MTIDDACRRRRPFPYRGLPASPKRTTVQKYPTTRVTASRVQNCPRAIRHRTNVWLNPSSMTTPFCAGFRHVARLRLSLHSSAPAIRSFSLTARQKTDGVFRELTSARVQQPWIEAWRQKNEQDGSSAEPGPAKPMTPPDHTRDLAPKKMKDSYHSVVRDKTETTEVKYRQLIACG
jgi:hypothetical protein